MNAHKVINIACEYLFNFKVFLYKKNITLSEYMKDYQEINLKAPVNIQGVSYNISAVPTDDK